ncbi:uncharacterized protein AAG666_014805 [Megaptera novaeangliae]
MARLSPTPHFLSVRATGPAGRTARAGPPRPPLGFGDSEIPSLPDPQPGPAAPPPTHRLYLLRERAEGVEAEAASSSVRRSAAIPQPFPAAATGLSGTAQGWRAALAAGADARRAPGGETLPLSVRPGKSSLAATSRERAGGRPNGEGSRGVGNGCHVAQVDRCSPPPPPMPAPGHDLWLVPELRWGASARPAGPARATPARGRSRLSRSPLRAGPGLAGSAASEPLPAPEKSSPESLTCFPLSLSWGHTEKQALFNASGFRGRREPF